MDKLKMHTPNLTQDHTARIRELFPGCVTEGRGEDGRVKLAVDFDQLRQELSEAVVDGPQERFHLNWPGKREALLAANAPVAKTLRPWRQESVDFDTTKNLLIEGDNLDALKLLQETYLGKIKLIYIDPPYNTGNDFVYRDNFAKDADEFLIQSNQRDLTGKRLVANPESNGRFHSDWLSMIYPRLRLARNLLRDDGAIFISIDDHEQASLKRICDDVFGEENFVSTIVWEKRYSPQNAVKWFSESHDFILVYARNKMNWSPNLLERSDEMNARYKNPDNDPRGAWKPVDSTAQGGHGTKAQFYELTAPNGKKHTLPNGRCWLYTQPVLQKMIEDNRVWFGRDGDNVPAIKRFLSEVKQGTACQTIWKYSEVGHSQEAKKEVNELFPEASLFDTPKPVRLIKRVLQVATSDNDLVLDFFSGSATAAHATLQINAEDGGRRRFILVQLDEDCPPNSSAYGVGFKTVSEIGKERVRRAGRKIKSNFSEKASDLDVGFRVLKIDSSNMADVFYAPDALERQSLELFVDNIKSGRAPEDLLFQVMLDWEVDLALPVSRQTIQGKDVFFVDGSALVACFDAQSGIDENLVKELAEHQPLRVVFRDAGFKDSAVKINVEQIFKSLSPSTEVKCI